MNRKHFLATGSAAFTAMLINPLQSFAQQTEPYKTEIVKAFVGAGHNNLPKVKELLLEYPNLLYSRHDLGNGDSEEAIEGAGHVGDREIANYLIEKGARPNIFVLTMLGETVIVKAMLERYPSLLTARGAHGFSLLHHATRGGENAKELLEHLKEKGLKEARYKL